MKLLKKFSLLITLSPLIVVLFVFNFKNASRLYGHPIYQFNGCKWHGCPCSGGDIKRYNETLDLEKKIKDLGQNFYQL